MNASVIARFAKAIGYPDEVPSGISSYAFAVDNGRIEATEASGRLVLTRALASSDEVDLALFAGYAAGRLQKEDAVLAYDPERDGLILWQELPAKSDEALLRRFFEVFAASCDWWLSRVKGSASASSMPEMAIRP